MFATDEQRQALFISLSALHTVASMDGKHADHREPEKREDIVVIRWSRMRRNCLINSRNILAVWNVDMRRHQRTLFTVATNFLALSTEVCVNFAKPANHFKLGSNRLQVQGQGKRRNLHVSIRATPFWICVLIGVP